MSRGEMLGKPVILARIGRPHGIKGWLKLNSYTSPAANVLDYRAFMVVGGPPGRTLEMDASRARGENVTAHFIGYDDPKTARDLTGLHLAVASKVLPPLPPGEYYWHQLQGLAVFNREGRPYGTVKQLLETGAHDVLVVVPGPDSIDDRERLIPYRPGQVIIDIDLAAGKVTVDWEADYLE